MKLWRFRIYFCHTCGKLECEYEPYSDNLRQCYRCCHGYQKDQRDYYIKTGIVK